MRYLSLLFILFNFQLPDAVAQGGLDPTFGTNGMVQFDTGNCTAIAIQPDGKIVTRGNSSTAVMRYNSDGSIDQNFADLGRFSNYIVRNAPNSIIIQLDGKILCGGGGSLNNIFSMFRLTSTGTLDSNFGNNGVANTIFLSQFGGQRSARIRSMVLQPDNRIIAAGDDGYYICLARYLPNGRIDSSFGINGQVYTITGAYGGGTNNVLIQPDGKILVGAVNYGGGQDGCVAVRYNTNGALDTTFGHTGKVFTPVGGLAYCNATVMQPDGKILQAGYNDSAFIVRLNSNGVPDPGFGINGIVKLQPGEIRAMALRADGKIILAGTSDTSLAVYRCNMNGSPDGTFGNSGRIKTRIGSVDNRIEAMALQADNKIVIGGFFVKYPWPNNRPNFILARYLPDAPTAIHELQPTRQIVVYPNPAVHSINIANASGIPIKSVSIYTLDGKLLFSTNETTIPITKLPGGCYLINIQFIDNLVVSQKTIIQH